MELLKNTMLIWKTTSSSGLTIPNQLTIWIFYISSLLSSLSIELNGKLLIKYVPSVRTIKSVLLITHHQSLNFQRISFIQTLSLTISISIFCTSWNINSWNSDKREGLSYFNSIFKPLWSLYWSSYFLLIYARSFWI